ncbi:hypothetical protein ACFX13_034740 [Malus domestica]
MIVRDDAETFVAAASKNFPDIYSALHAEAYLVARECLFWAVVRGFTNLQIEGDSLQIVGELSDSSSNW